MKERAWVGPGEDCDFGEHHLFCFFIGWRWNQDGSSASLNQPRDPSGSFCASWASVWCQVSLQYLSESFSSNWWNHWKQEKGRRKGKRELCRHMHVCVSATDSTSAAGMKLHSHCVTSADSTPSSWWGLITFILPPFFPLLTFPYAPPSGHCLTRSCLTLLTNLQHRCFFFVAYTLIKTTTILYIWTHRELLFEYL